MGWLQGKAMKENSRDIDVLKASLRRNWERLDLNLIKNCIDSLDHHML